MRSAQRGESLEACCRDDPDLALLFPLDHAGGRLMRAFGACARAVLLEKLAHLPDAASGRPAG